MAQAIDALTSARSFLNDNDAISWSDSVLFPKLQEAHRELVLELALHNAPVIRKQTTTVITVNAGDTTLGANLPTDIVEPISMMERDVGGDNSDFYPMWELSFVPSIDPEMYLRYWVWMGDTIRFVGATSAREVMLRYTGKMATPTVNTDSLGFIFAELYMGPRIAALALESRGKDSTSLNNLAQSNLDKIIRKNVTGSQRPVRRRAYRSSSLGLPEGSSRLALGNTVQVLNMQFIYPNVLPDGILTSFQFSSTPRYIVYNGQWRFENVGYLRSGNTITLIDESGVTITPQVGDNLQAEVV